MSTELLSGGEAFELRLLFLHELAGSFGGAREAEKEFVGNPCRGAAVERLRDFFHRIAGTAGSVGFPVLGRMGSMCENLAELILKGDFDAPEQAVPLFADALAAVKTLLADHGGLETAQAESQAVDLQSVLLPSEMDDDRRLPKVMVVDDDVFSARLIDGCLRAAGFASSYCTNSQEAIAAIESHLPDLIILDVLMPGIDGFEICRRVRANSALQFTPVIFVTQKTSLQERVRGLEVGANDYITKPFEPLELVARVRSHLGRLAVLREMAIRDGLTKCYNHKYFKTRLEQEILRAKRYDLPLTLAMADIDHFKVINDSYGHPVGDLVLVRLANLMMASVRSTDIISRYGGEEFAILLVQAAAEEAEIIAERIRQRIEKQKFPIPSDDKEDTVVRKPVTVSIGVAELTKDHSVASLIESCDHALYEAKAAGRNRLSIAGLQAI